MVAPPTNPQILQGYSPLAVHWTREECAGLEKAGFLNYPYELVEGVINKMGQNIRHAGVIRRILTWLFRIFGEAYVLTQTTIDVRPEDNPTSEPQPDAIVLTRADEDFEANPKPDELRLCIEVADTTLAYDLSVKAGLYARAGLIEYWVVNIPERKLHIHREPVNGTYENVTVHAETDTVATLAAPEAMLQVLKLFPRASSPKR
ncbi:MAG TPA: Uma2 family endonuclease [Chthonomonadaceae bacterium]|nr:Uma2 family endonuclease [Chthonomonadaceae bacterium]